MNGGLNELKGKALQYDGALWGPFVFVKYSEIGRPATLFTFMDEDAEAMAADGFWVCPDQTDFWWEIPGVRHGGGANLAFADAHAKFHRWKFPSRKWSGDWKTPTQNDWDRADLVWLESKMQSLLGPPP